MKTLVNLSRIVVGVLFIFSGLVKANDPIGLSYKMQEFFFAWEMSALDGISLVLSILMISFEIIAGAALLLGWKIKTVSWLLLLLIIFFTFLTGYAYLSGKFKNCGCFGDCLPITSLQSFVKDLLLLMLILLIFFNNSYIKPILGNGSTILLLLLIALFSFGSQWYTLQYLPIADCLPFKKGNNISDQMKVPENAIPDSTIIVFEYDRNGEKVTFTADEFPDDFNDSTYTFVSRNDKLIRPGKNNEPPIKSFSLTTQSGADVTQSILNAGQIMLLFMEDADTPIDEWEEAFKTLYNHAVKKHIPIFIVSSSAPSVQQAMLSIGLPNIEVLNGDNTMIRMAARTNPTIYVLRKGTIMDKKSYKNFDNVIL